MSVDRISPVAAKVAQHRIQEADLAQRAGGASSPGEAFEGIMLRKMVQSLRSTVDESGLWSGVTGGQIYDHFIEEALSDYLAKSGGIGIAQLFETQEGSQIDPVTATGMAALEVATGDTTSGAPAPVVSSDDGSRPLSELMPPQYDSWLNSPVAEQTLRASLEGGKLR